MKRMKSPTSYRHSEEAYRLLKLLAKKLGLPQTGIIELAIRVLAKREKVG